METYFGHTVNKPLKKHTDEKNDIKHHLKSKKQRDTEDQVLGVTKQLITI